MLRPPPSSTLSPYTTLFRSVLGPAVIAVVLTAGVGAGPGIAVAGADELGDRKSTRLNSSHVKNSYAVFCWKKKSVNIHPHTDKSLPIGGLYLGAILPGDHDH